MTKSEGDNLHQLPVTPNSSGNGSPCSRDASLTTMWFWFRIPL